MHELQAEIVPAQNLGVLVPPLSALPLLLHPLDP